MVHEAGSAGRRLAAFAIDYLIIAAYIVVLTLVSFAVRSQVTAIDVSASTAPWLFDLLAFTTLVLPVTLYFALYEASRHRATVGKRRMGLVVVTEGGESLDRGRSLLRSALKFAPWQIAHTSLFHIPGWPVAVETVPAAAAAGLGIASVVAVLYAVSVVAFADRRTPYDYVAGTRVIQR